MIEPRFDAVTVELDLVNPLRSVWRSAVQRGEAGRHKIRKSAAATIGRQRIGAASRRSRYCRPCGRFSFRARLSTRVGDGSLGDGSLGDGSLGGGLAGNPQLTARF